MAYFTVRTNIVFLLLALSGCAGSTPPKVSPTTQECVPVHLEQFPSPGIYIRGVDHTYFGPEGIIVPKGTAAKLTFFIANGLQDDIFLNYGDHLAQIASTEFPDGFEFGGVSVDLNLVMTGTNYKHVRGAYDFVRKGLLIDDGFVLASVVRPDHSHGKQCDGIVEVWFDINFCVRRTGKWYSLSQHGRIMVHYR